MGKKDEKNPAGQPSDTAAAHNVPDPQDGKRPADPQATPPAARTPETPNPAAEVRYSSAGSRNVMRRNMHLPGCWAQGGTLEGFTSVAWALTELAELRGVATNPNTHEVDKIRAARIGKESRIWIHPTDETDTDGTEVKRDKQGKVRINLYNYLAQQKLLIAIGRRERFELKVVTDSESPVGPALLLDFSKPLETKVVATRKKGDAAKSTGKKSPGPKNPEPKNPEPDSEDEEDEEE